MPNATITRGLAALRFRFLLKEKSKQISFMWEPQAVLMKFARTMDGIREIVRE